MHIRLSKARGMHVVDDSSQHTIGILEDPLIDPDTGHIIGFFVLPVFLGESPLFLQTADIISWGTRIHVLSDDKLGPPQDFVRLSSRLHDPRSFLGQILRVEKTGRSLGRLADIQFNTRHFMTEWLFPRTWLLARRPLPASDIVEVTADAIWMRNPLRSVSERLVQPDTVDVSLLHEVVPQVQTRIKNPPRGGL
jgi:uncharacterized protein YrrD